MNIKDKIFLTFSDRVDNGGGGATSTAAAATWFVLLLCATWNDPRQLAFTHAQQRRTSQHSHNTFHRVAML